METKVLPDVEEVKVEAKQDEAKPKRPLWAINLDLYKPVASRFIKTRKQGGKDLQYIPWYSVVKLLSFYTNNNWDYEILDVHNDDKYCIVKTRITIYGSDGKVSREATGIEELDTKGYGDYVSGASSMSLRRAAATLGLGLHLYDK